MVLWMSSHRFRIAFPRVHNSKKPNWNCKPRHGKNGTYFEWRPKNSKEIKTLLWAKGKPLKTSTFWKIIKGGRGFKAVKCFLFRREYLDFFMGLRPNKFQILISGCVSATCSFLYQNRVRTSLSFHHLQSEQASYLEALLKGILTLKINGPECLWGTSPVLDFPSSD